MQHATLDPPVRLVLDRLYAHHGVPEIDEEPDDILATLVATILSQATTNALSSQSFGSLLDAFEADWARIAHAPAKDVIESIRYGGLSHRKGPRIQAILTQTFEKYGDYTLEHMHDAPIKEAYKELLAMDGVGPKTASFVLMRAAKMPLFAMDTHILRLARRLKWIDAKASDTSAHRTMLGYIPQGEHDPAHMVMIWHGRALCHARSPVCGSCPLLDLCQHGQAQP